MDRAFHVGAEREPHHTVLGLSLLPMTVGHLFLLHEVEAGYLQPMEDLSVADVIASAFILAQPHEDARRLIGTIRAKVFMRLWGWRASRMNMALEVQKFGAYLREQWLSPATRAVQSDRARMLVAPEHWRLMAVLMSVFGMTERDALNVPVVKARCLMAVHCEMQGTVELSHTPQTSILLAALKRQGEEVVR